MKNKLKILAFATVGLLAQSCNKQSKPQDKVVQEVQKETPAQMAEAPVNPFLVQESVYPMIHWNSASSDVTDIPTWEGNSKITEDQIQWIPSPPSNVGMAHYPYANGEEAIFLSGSNRTSKYRVTDGALELISTAKIEGLDEMDASDDEIQALAQEMDTVDESVFLPKLQAYNEKHNTNLNTLAGGVYTFMDNEGNYFSGWGTKLYKFADVNKGDINSEIEIVKQIDLKDFLPADKGSTISRLVGLNVTYDGYVVIGMPGIVAVMDRDLNKMEYVLFEGEAIDNGISTDVDGGIYVVTSKYMRKLVWDGTNLSDDESTGAWKSEYDYVPNPRAASRGAGNTPTLMGFGPDEDHLVIVCDAGDPIKVTAFWRDDIPEDFVQKEGAASRRIADQKALNIDVPATIEWSPHVQGYGVMMFASAWPDPVRLNDQLDVYGTVHTAGVSREAPRGSEKFEWNPETRALESQWTTDYGMQWALFPYSSVSNTVSLCELEKGVYSIVTVDWNTGKEVSKTELGTSPIFNTMGGFFVPMKNGDWIITGTFGPVRISKKGA